MQAGPAVAEAGEVSVAGKSAAAAAAAAVAVVAAAVAAAAAAIEAISVAKTDVGQAIVAAMPDVEAPDRSAAEGECPAPDFAEIAEVQPRMWTPFCLTCLPQTSSADICGRGLQLLSPGR